MIYLNHHVSELKFLDKELADMWLQGQAVYDEYLKQGMENLKKCTWSEISIF
jgi:hypothetical protein